ncbi:primase C-terminal domain-containing protein [Mesorhizobium sp. M0618]|uniref:primase C-terminal domain-containing protein n=1 Tax=Mesorhizobium sp. M0618 TaxID=2956972 RepID=UPI00333839BC
MSLPDLSTIDHHPAVQEIVDVLCTKTQNLDRGFFQAEVAYFLGKMASMMRATVITKDRGEIPVNIYALALATSGFGKGHSVHVVEDEFLKGFKSRFMEETFPVLAEQQLWTIANNRAARNGTDQQEEYDKTAKEFKQCGAFLFTFDSGSPEGVKQTRQKLLRSACGSINLQIDEIGSNLVGSVDLLTLFLELYDQGIVKQKLIKNSSDNQRVEELDGKTPANMLLFGTPSKLFDGGATEDQFYSFLETGYARRCIFGYGHRAKIMKELTAAEVYAKLTQKSTDQAVTKWQHHFYTLADPSLYDWKMEVSESVSITLLDYKLTCERLAEDMPEHEEIQKAEISHRYSKALKLAGAYAFVDGSTEVMLEHLLAAIKLVEESGQAFQKILTREKNYVKLAKFVASVGHEVTHADIHEKMPFYPKSSSPRNDMMMLATSWGYVNNVIVKKSFRDGIEFFKGETLEATDLERIVVSYSNHWAYNYLPELVPFDKLHLLTQTADYHWANHHFKSGHRAEENVIAGFNMIVIDVDGGASLHQAHELMKEYKFLTYTTKRHSDEENRFRLMLPINYRLDLDQDEYKEFMNNIMDWLPFATDESANQRAKKWESFAGGAFHYNLEGETLDVLKFIPKTSRNELYKKSNQELGSLDNLERWFAGRIASGNRNNQMIKYALCLVDSGWELTAVKDQVHAFNKKLSDSMTEQEIDSTIMVTVAKRYQKP